MKSAIEKSSLDDGNHIRLMLFLKQHHNVAPAHVPSLKKGGEFD